MDGAYSLAGKRVFVAGHRGMVGSAIVDALPAEDPAAIITAPRTALDLRDKAAVRRFLADERPDVVLLAAAKVGGILANATFPVDFLFDNLEIELAVIRGAFEADVERLVFLGSSCIYPREAPQPICEDALLTGPLEETNAPYAVAKIAGINMCAALRKQYGARYVSAMPTNLYGPRDNFDLATSHVVPALMRKAHEARLARAPAMTVWGTGTPRREFMHVADCARAILHVAKHYDDLAPINVGVGEDIAIGDLAALIARTVGFTGALAFDPDKPDGTPRKLLDTARLRALGWRPTTRLDEGLASTYAWFLGTHADAA